MERVTADTAHAAMESEPNRKSRLFTGQIAIRAILRLCLFVFVGACWGLFLGFMLAMLSHWTWTGDTFDAALHRFAERYAAGATLIGVVAGAFDFVICATWPKTTGLLIHSLLWFLIPGNILGLLVISTSLVLLILTGESSSYLRSHV
jgi:hypothetical protein